MKNSDVFNQMNVVRDHLVSSITKAMVADKYGSEPEEAANWGYVKNTWQDQEIQDVQWEEFVKESMKGDPWRKFNGRDAF